MKDSISISDAAIQTGLSQKQLREYEAKGFINTPLKVRCGCDSIPLLLAQSTSGKSRFSPKYKNQGFTLPMAASKAYAEIDLGKEDGKYE